MCVWVWVSSGFARFFDFFLLAQIEATSCTARPQSTACILMRQCSPPVAQSIIIVAALVLAVGGSAASTSGDETRNLAAGVAGGRAEAIVDGDSRIHRVIDGAEALEGRDSAWSFNGRLDDAWALFSLGGGGAGVVRSVRMVTGVEGRTDARVSAMRLWTTDVESPSLPSAWFDDPGARIPEQYGWRQIFPRTARLQSQAGGALRQATAYNGRIFLGGESDVQVCFDPVSASAVLVKIDGAINEEHRDRLDKSHLRDHTDASVVEFQVFSVCRGAAGGSGLFDFPVSGMHEGDAHDEAGEEMIEGIKLQSLLTPFNSGSWFHPDGTTPAFSSCAPSSQWHSLGENEHATPGSTERVIPEDDDGRRDVESVCQDISGLELVFAGDARMRHAFLATAAFFRPSGYVRGYVNRHLAIRHGAFDANERRSCGGSAQCGVADADDRGLNQGAAHSSRSVQEAEAEGACSAAYVPFDMELPCAGASPWQFRPPSPAISTSQELRTWELGVCDNRAVLRLVETSDAKALSWGLQGILEERAMCEQNATHAREGGQACYEATILVVSTPVPTLERADLRQLQPVALPATFIDDSLQFAREMADLGARLTTRASSAGTRDWQAVVSQRATALVYSTLEPFSLIHAHHAQLNRQVALVNADTRVLLRRARIPVLDSHALMVGRSGCSADGVHWAGLAQRPRVRFLLSVGAKVSRHVRMQKSAARPESVGEKIKGLRRAVVEAERLGLARLRHIPPSPRSGLPTRGGLGWRVGEDDGVRWNCSGVDAKLAHRATEQGGGGGWSREDGGVWGSGERGVMCQAYVVGPCDEIKGDEEGYWRAEEDGTYTWHLQECVLRRFSHEDARHCVPPPSVPQCKRTRARTRARAHAHTRTHARMHARTHAHTHARARVFSFLLLAGGFCTCQRLRSRFRASLEHARNTLLTLYHAHTHTHTHTHTRIF